MGNECARLVYHSLKLNPVGFILAQHLTENFDKSTYWITEGERMRNRIIYLMVIFGLFFVSFFCYANPSSSIENTDIIKGENPKLLQSNPVIISSDVNFTDYGFSGDGTQELPFLIDSLEIITTDSNGIYITNTSKYFVVSNCYVDAEVDGIYINGVANGTAVIINNVSENHDYSCIRVKSSPSTIITGNTCRNSIWYGIRLQNSPLCILSDNYCTENIEDGIILSYSGNSTVFNNNCSGNGYSGINFSLSEYSFVSDNICNDNLNGIRLYSSDQTSVINNTCKNNENRGIYIYFSDECLVKNNTCINNMDGITLTFTEYDIVEYNNCSLNKEEGIRLSIAESSIITNNTVLENRFGIYLNEDNSSVIKDNTISLNKDNGITFFYSFYTDVSWNVIYENQKNGIELAYAKYTTISYNLIQSSSDYCVYLNKSSKYNQIHHNTFVNNKQDSSSQANDNGEENLWYDISLKEGNYWSNSRKGKEYSIDGTAENIDPYPLSSPIVPFLTTSETIHSEIFTIFLSLSLFSISSYLSYMRKKKQK
ncbi:MAG: hypothetical protein HGN29_06505 [Asgard group archaeon]|nr:hypothetical protein [Asgard group archaeon]